MVLYLALVLAADLLHEAPAFLCVYRDLSLSIANLRILLYAPLLRARPNYVCGFRLITGGALCRLRHDLSTHMSSGSELKQDVVLLKHKSMFVYISY